MGHKVNPYGFRLGVIYPWKSNWYADRDYSEQLHEDIWIRKHIRKRLSRAGISSIDIERKGDQIWVFIRTARPGIVIGRKGAEVDRIRKDIERFTKKRVDVKVEDMNQAASESRPETDAALLAQGVAEQLAGRVAFRRAMRRAVQTSMRAGALGVKVMCGGRLGGTEMSRSEWYREGRVPLHTLRAKVDFGAGRGEDHGRHHRREGVGVSRGRDPVPGAGDRARPGSRAGRRIRAGSGCACSRAPAAAAPLVGRPATADRACGLHPNQRPAARGASPAGRAPRTTAAAAPATSTPSRRPALRRRVRRRQSRPTPRRGCDS